MSKTMNKMSWESFSFALVLFASTVIVGQNVLAVDYYVSPSGNDTNAGTSWAAAKQTIQAGVNATSDGDSVLVTNGTYVLTSEITVSRGITVLGVNGPTATIVNGNYPAYEIRCFRVEHANAALDGFTITNGYVTFDGGGGVYNKGGTIQNCTISGNSTYGGSYCPGGGVYNEGGMIKNCTISGNSAWYAGGGVFNKGGTVQNCTVSGNSAFTTFGVGGGVYNDYDGTVQNCTVSGNLTTYGGRAGGVYNYGTVRNCIISGNSQLGNPGAMSDVGGMYNDGTVQNCTVSGNSQWGGDDYGGSVGGVYNDNDGTLINCIVINNASDFDAEISGVLSPDITYSCSSVLTSGVGNITSDPSFVDPGQWVGTNFVGGNFQLQSISPCINAGMDQSWMTGATDIAGNPRIISGRVDMGAYESPYATPVIGPTIKANGATDNVNVNYPETVSITVEMYAGVYTGIDVDWWVVAYAHSGEWYYLSSAMQWTQFNGDLVFCRPMHQGKPFNLSSITVLDRFQLPVGTYYFWFAVDYPADGILDPNGAILYDQVTVTVQ